MLLKSLQLLCYAITGREICFAPYYSLTVFRTDIIGLGI